MTVNEESSWKQKDTRTPIPGQRLTVASPTLGHAPMKKEKLENSKSRPVLRIIVKLWTTTWFSLCPSDCVKHCNLQWLHMT